jgi:hypothetical protein
MIALGAESCCGDCRSFGCHSAQGCRFAERILTVVQTLRLQQRLIFLFL